jgi:hypothetical protein
VPRPSTAASTAPASTAPASSAPVPARPSPVPGGPVLARRERAAKPAEPTAPAPAAGEPDATESADAVTFALDDVIEAWPEALGLLKAPVRAGIQDAQPIALENGVIVFGVPKRRFDAINERFRKEAAAIKEAFASRLGAAPRFMLRAHDFDKVDALRPPSSGTGGPAPADAEAPELEPEPEEDEVVDLTELADAHDAPQHDSVTRLVAGLGAEVVDERRRG